MAAGPGKYDDLCTWVRTQAGGALGVLVMVCGGQRGTGFSVQLTEAPGFSAIETAKAMRHAMIACAEQLEGDIRRMKREEERLDLERRKRKPDPAS